MKVIVTGGAGFIGSHIVDLLVQRGYEVVVVDDLSNGKKENVNSRANLVIKSINDDLSELFPVDAVIHCAANVFVRPSFDNPLKYANTNILGSLNLIELAIKHKAKFIFSSSAAVYSSVAEVPTMEEDEIKPESPYGLDKYIIEEYLRVLAVKHGLSYCCLRYSNVYGPRQDSKGEGGVVAIFGDKIPNEEEINVYGDGDQTRDFVFVKDVASANVFALENNLSGVFNVSNKKETTINELIAKIEDLSGKKAKVNFMPRIKGELYRSCLDNGRLVDKGWKPEKGFQKGLKELLDFSLNSV